MSFQCDANCDENSIAVYVVFSREIRKQNAISSVVFTVSWGIVPHFNSYQIVSLPKRRSALKVEAPTR